MGARLAIVNRGSVLKAVNTTTNFSTTSREPSRPIVSMRINCAAVAARCDYKALLRVSRSMFLFIVIPSNFDGT
jgi:hypothetical protein